MYNPYKKFLGKTVKYYDYLDAERYGRIVAIEPNPNSPDTPFIYIEDEEQEFNEHRDIVNGKEVHYAEIRLSSEIYQVE